MPKSTNWRVDDYARPTRCTGYRREVVFGSVNVNTNIIAPAVWRLSRTGPRARSKTNGAAWLPMDRTTSTP